ncbi:hypothetical protein EVC30_073 [Rhizobium phage RHph_Y1_11]|nr:hypothetical protein EVC30_073 [Rhizobium phage RHph_Y1_11]
MGSALDKFKADLAAAQQQVEEAKAVVKVTKQKVAEAAKAERVQGKVGRPSLYGEAMSQSERNRRYREKQRELKKQQK